MVSQLKELVKSVEKALKDATERAQGKMATEDSESGRRKILAEWERELTRHVRPAFQDVSYKVRTTHNIPPEEKDQLWGRISSVPVDMVSSRSLLEGLVKGQGPTRNNIGGAYPPSSTCGPEVKAAARKAFEKGLEDFRAVRDFPVKGELLGDWVRRVNPSLTRAVQLAEAVLKDSGREYREDLVEFERESTELFSKAMLARDKTADHLAEAETENLRRLLLERVTGLPKATPPGQDIDQLALQELEWAGQVVAKAQARLRKQGLKMTFDEKLELFAKEIRAWIGDCKGWWKKAPTFSIVRLEDLDRGVKPGPPSGPGIFVRFYPDGHLREARNADGSLSLKLSKGIAHARYEDTANVAEFHANGVLEEYGGRYERETRARITFADWVIERVREMVRFEASRP